MAEVLMHFKPTNFRDKHENIFILKCVVYLLEIKIEDALNVVIRSHNIEADGGEVFLGFTDQKTCIIHQISHSLQ